MKVFELEVEDKTYFKFSIVHFLILMVPNLLPTSSAWWVLFSCRRAHNVSSNENRRTHPKLSQFGRKTCSKNLPDFEGKPARTTCPQSVPARFSTTLTHFWHFSNCKNVSEKCARSSFDDNYTLWSLFKLQKCAWKVCTLDFRRQLHPFGTFRIANMYPKSVPAGFLTTITHFGHFSNC